MKNNPIIYFVVCTFVVISFITCKNLFTNSLERHYEHALNTNIATFTRNSLECNFPEQDWENEQSLIAALMDCERILEHSSSINMLSYIKEIEKKSIQEAISICETKESNQSCVKSEKKLRKFLSSTKYREWIKIVPEYLESKLLYIQLRQSAAEKYLEKKYHSTSQGSEWAQAILIADDQYKKMDKLSEKVKREYPF